MRKPVSGNHLRIETIAWLLEHCEAKLMTWELDLLNSIQGRQWLTSKQRAKLNEL